MFPAIFEAEILAIDLHGVLDYKPEFFEPLLNLLKRADKSVYIVSGPPASQIFDELSKLGYHAHYHYNAILSVVDHLKSQSVEMWMDDKKTWWCNDSDWWKSKGEICQRLKADIMLDDKGKFREGFPKGHPTQFITFDGFKSIRKFL